VYSTGAATADGHACWPGWLTCSQAHFFRYSHTRHHLYMACVDASHSTVQHCSTGHCANGVLARLAV
jgi:hypothetical protein